MRRVLALACFMLCAAAIIPALALTGNAPPATGWAARPIVMIVDARGDLCTGTALARDLVLTAAHCVTRAIDYQVKAYQTGQPIRVALDRAPSAFRFTPAMPPAAPPPTWRCSSSPRRCPTSSCRQRWPPRAASRPARR